MTSPLLGARGFEVPVAERCERPAMTVAGTVRAIGFLMALMIVAAVGGWALTAPAPAVDAGGPPPFVFVAALGAFVLAIAAIFRPLWSRALAPCYAVAQGLVIGAISRHYEAASDGVVAAAVFATMAALAAMALLYRSGLVVVTRRLLSRVLAAAGGLLVFWVVAGLATVTGIAPGLLAEPGVSFVASVVGVVVASCFLLLDFETIEAGVRNGAPKELEWQAAFGVVLTLVWLYLEILSLLGDGDGDD